MQEDFHKLPGRYMIWEMERDRRELADLSLASPTRWQRFRRWCFGRIFGLLPQ